MQASIKEDEKLLRQSLGIPDDAEQVLIFAESSHWDPNWMLTSEEYFDRYVRNNLDIALAELLQEPRRIYSIESMFFLRMYWERCPDQQSKVRQLINEGRLRITNSGVTTADTILPKTETILRGFLLGQEWLRANGMTQESRLAYFSDSFGGSPALPSLLKAAGFDYTAITRIDGMRFPGTHFGPAKQPPDYVSTAERLLKQERSLDFIWRDYSKAEVLCHWNAFTYGQGDLLAHRGLIRLYNSPTAILDTSEANIANRVHKYTSQLAPYSKTPYLFCPIGFDFVKPIPGLVSLLDLYNWIRYPTTGVWVLNAGLDDYLALIDFYRQILPVCELDPNPYWTGFYTSRPTLKERCYRLVEKLLQAELLSLQTNNPATIQSTSEELTQSWWYAALTNHHDYITGTSPDRIVAIEQIPWIEQAIEKTQSTIDRLNGNIRLPIPPTRRGNAISWKDSDDQITIQSKDYQIGLSQTAGGTILYARHLESEKIFLQSFSNDLVLYKDSGGLWRMGNEYLGGTWKEQERSSSSPVHLRIQNQDAGLEASWQTKIHSPLLECKMCLTQDSPLIGFEVAGIAPLRHTITARFRTPLKATRLVMDVPGGIVFRPLQKRYSPTFWPLHCFIHLQDDENGWGLAIFRTLPGAISCHPDGTLELIALRNAPRERAFHFFPLSGNPAKGVEKEIYSCIYYLLFTPHGNWLENKLPEIAADLAARSTQRYQNDNGGTLASSVFRLDRQDVKIMAAKLASRGEGWIIRLYTLGAMSKSLTLTCIHRKIKAAFLCDTRERDLQPLQTVDGDVRLTMPGTIATLRLLF
jgi:alpha-mannosidase